MSKRYKTHNKNIGPILEQGTLVGEYKIRHFLDAGGMGSVYAAIHPVIGKKVAIKLLHPHIAKNPENIQRFKQEAQVVNAIGDHGIVDIFSFGEHTDGRYYFVMEYLKGERLLDFLKRYKQIGAFASSHLLRMIALSLAAAHDKNIIHRDLKAENIFLIPSNDNRWPPKTKILDFGLAKLLEPLPGQTRPQTRQGTTLGTPYYMSPEQCKGKPLDARSDIYALGVLAFEMVEGQLPFINKDPIEVMHMHLNSNPEFSLNNDIPHLFKELIYGCLEKNPDDRPQDMREFIATLENIFPALILPGTQKMETVSKVNYNVKYSIQNTRKYNLNTVDFDETLDEETPSQNIKKTQKDNDTVLFDEAIDDNKSKKNLNIKRFDLNSLLIGIVIGSFLGFILTFLIIK